MLPLLLLSLLLLTPPPQVNDGAGPPIREQELLTLVRNKTLFTEEQVLEMVRARGIGFRLTDSVRKALRKEGASDGVMAAVEKAAEALKRRSTAEEAAAAPKPVPAPPPLDEQQQTRLLEQVREHALEYTDRLPNFICVQITKRLVDPDGRGSWYPQDVIQVRLAYNERKESYQVVTINDQVTSRSYDSLGGATSTGEFGTLLHNLFMPETQAHFTWVGPSTFRNRQVYEYDYTVTQDRSRWHVTWEKQLTIVPAYRGHVAVDAENQQVLRLSMEAEEIPASFPIRFASTALEYDYATIAGRSFLLPARAVVEMKEGRMTMRNDIQFRQYRRFSTDTKLSFDETPPDKN